MILLKMPIERAKRSLIIKEVIAGFQCHQHNKERNTIYKFIQGEPLKYYYIFFAHLYFHNLYICSLTDNT